MTKFRLTKKSSNRLQTTFHVIDPSGAVCGSINVKNHQVDDLMKHWVGGAQEERREPEMKAPVAKRMSAAKTKAAVLRGC